MYRFIVLVLVFATIAGCGTSEINVLGEGKTYGENISPQIEVELETTLEVKKENDNLLFEITLTNRGEETVELPFSSGQQYEIVVKNEEGKEVYRYSEGKMFTQALLSLKLEAGEKLTWEDEWDQKFEESKWVTNGQYEVVAEVLVQDYEENLVINQGALIAEKKVTINNEEVPLENNAFRQIKVEGENGEYIVTGEARVYEAVFHYAVTEGHFYYIEEWVTVDEGGPSWSPFTINISIAEDDLPFNGTITLELFEESAKDGSKVNQLSVPLETINP